MQIPHEPQRGDLITAEWGAQVVRALRAIWPRQSKDVLPSVAPGGTTYSVIGGNQAPGGGVTYDDFSLFATQDDSGLYVNVRFGNIYPSIPKDAGVFNFPSDFHNEDGSIAKSVKLGPVTESGDAYVKITVNGSTKKVTDNVLAILPSSGEGMDFSDGVTYQLLGSYSVSEDGSTIEILNSRGIGSQNMVYCGGNFAFWPA